MRRSIRFLDLALLLLVVACEPAFAEDGALLFDRAWQRTFSGLDEADRRALERSALPLEFELERARLEARHRQVQSELERPGSLLLQRSGDAAAGRSLARLLRAAELTSACGIMETESSTLGVRLHQDALSEAGWRAVGPAESGAGALLAVHRSGAVVGLRFVSEPESRRRALVEQALRLGGAVRSCDSELPGELCLQAPGWLAFSRHGVLVDLSGPPELALELDELLWDGLGAGPEGVLSLAGVVRPCRLPGRPAAASATLELAEGRERERKPRGPTTPEVVAAWDQLLDVRESEERNILLAPFAWSAAPPYQHARSASKRDSARRAGLLLDTPAEATLRLVERQGWVRLARDRRLLQSGLTLQAWEVWHREHEAIALHGELLDLLGLSTRLAPGQRASGATLRGREKTHVLIGNRPVDAGTTSGFARFGAFAEHLTAEPRPCPSGLGDACLVGTRSADGRLLVLLQRGSVSLRVYAEPLRAWEIVSWLDRSILAAARNESPPPLPLVPDCLPPDEEPDRAPRTVESLIENLRRSLEEPVGTKR